jgi:hypothetical protein
VGCVVQRVGWDQVGVDEPELDELDELDEPEAGAVVVAAGVEELELSDEEAVDDEFEVLELDADVDEEPEDPEDPLERLSVL